MNKWNGELTNLFPGHPPKPVGITDPNIRPSDLDPYGNCQWTEKWDENRVVLYNGIAFNRVGTLYTKLPEEYTFLIAKHLENVFKQYEYFHFDVGFISHGDMKNHCFLYDIPQHKGTFRERDYLMRSLRHKITAQEIQLPVSSEDMGMTPDEFFEYGMNRKDPRALESLEGLVGKPWNSRLSRSVSEAQAMKQGWKKCRHQ